MVFIMAMAATEHIKIPRMHSIKPKVLWVNPVSESNRSLLAEKDRYFVFSLISPDGKLVNADKRIGCAEGHYLAAKMNTTDATMDFYCDGSYLGRSKSRTLTGKPLVPFAYTGVVPHGKIFAIGDHIDSYDSRYIGFVDITQVREIVSFTLP